MNSQDPSPFAHALRHYRLTRGMTQEALAERAGVSTDTIRALERGRRAAPRAITLGLLADALDLPAAERSALAAAADSSAAEYPFSPASARPAPIPLPPDTLIGRERELTEIAELLNGRGERLLTLLGPGGVGKTRLALEVLARRDQGGLFVDLSALLDPALVPPTIARAAGVREAGQTDAWNRLLADLRQRGLLVVLDNFEQVVEASLAVSELLAACPRVRVLVTSRMPLRLRGERRYPVAPLTSAPGTDGHAGAAVRLFIARAEAVDPGFASGDVATIAAICERLDGLPLAIELAAARVALLPPAALLDRLDQRLAVLTGGARDLPDRHQTMRAAIAWSHGLLTPEEQTVFRRMAVFRGGCAIALAVACLTAPAGQNGPTESVVLDALTSLLDMSLLTTSPARPDEPRVELLETIREYAGELLVKSGEGGVMRHAHAVRFLALAEHVDNRFTSPEQADEMNRLERDHDNLRAALAWCLAEEPGLGLRLAAALWQFWWTHGHLSEGRAWLERMLAAAPAPSGTRARALLGAGYLATQQSDWMPARAHFEAGLALNRRLGDDRLTARLLNELGWLLTYFADYAEARPVLEEALAISRTLPGESPILESALVYLARLVRHQGETGYARALLEESLALAEARDASRSIAAVRVVLGDLDRAEEKSDAAEAEYHAALAAARRAGHTTYIAWAVGGLGQIAMWRGDLDQATDYLEEALALYRDLGNTHSIGFVLHMLGVTAVRAGDIDRAFALVRESLRLRWQLGVRGNVAGNLEELAMIVMRQGQPEAAVRYLAGAATARASVGAVASPSEAHAVTAAIATLRATLGAGGFARAWAAGEAAPLESTVRDALRGSIVAGG